MGGLIYLQFDVTDLLQTSAKGHFNNMWQREGRGRPRIRHPRKDITLSSNQPPLSAQRTTPQCSGPQLAVPFGFNTNKGEYRRSTLGELQPLQREGSRVETANVWRVSSFNLGACYLRQRAQRTHADLEKGARYVSNKVQAERKQIIRRNGTGKYTVKACAFCPRRRTSPSLSMVA